VNISAAASSWEGTSANLLKNDNLLLIDLFYAMMLPSGNDAAFAIAEYFGRQLQKCYFYGTYNRKMIIYS